MLKKYLSLGLFAVAAGCGTSSEAVRETIPLKCRAPNDPAMVMFAGQSTAEKDEDTAIEHAREKALAEIGASLCAAVDTGETPRKKLAKDEEARVIDLRLRVNDGTVELHGVHVAAIEAVKLGDGYAACAQIEVPKTELDSITEPAKHALADAKTKLDGIASMCGAQGLEELRSIKQAVAGICERITTDGVTRATIESRVEQVSGELEQRAKQQSESIAMGLACTLDGKPIDCPVILDTAAHVALENAGFTVDDKRIPQSSAAAVAKGDTTVDAGCGAAKAVLTVNTKAGKKTGGLAPYPASAEASWTIIAGGATKSGDKGRGTSKEATAEEAHASAARTAVEKAKVVR